MLPYLFWSFILGLIWLLLYLFRQDLRYEMLFSSVLFLPFGLTQPLFVPEYWNPNVIYKFFGIFDIESLLWCFFTGGISAVIYEEIFKRKLGKERMDAKSRHHAYIIYALLLLGVLWMLFIKFFTDFSVLRSSFLFVLCIFIYFIYSRPDLFKSSIFSGVLFSFLYISSLLLVDSLFPGFIANQWTIQGSLGLKLNGIVIEEYIYAFLFGIVWSVIYVEIKNIKFRKAQ